MSKLSPGEELAPGLQWLVTAVQQIDALKTEHAAEMAQLMQEVLVNNAYKLTMIFTTHQCNLTGCASG